VQMRTRIMNQVQALAMNKGRGRADFEELALAPWDNRRRKELLELLTESTQPSKS